MSAPYTDIGSVAQVSQPAVSPISNRQARDSTRMLSFPDSQQAGSPAIEQVGKPAQLPVREMPTLSSLDGHIPKPGQPLTPEEVRELDRAFNELPTEKVLAWAWERYRTRAAIGTSFQGAGLVMIHLAKQNGLPLPVFTLDTGLLFPETVALKQRLEDFFGFKIESLEPDLTVEEQAHINGPELWKNNPDLCCTIRKVLPLRDKLCDLDCWLTGVRREQSDSRAGIGILELYVFDAASGRDIVKLNPMANWTRKAVWNYLREHKIPYNPLVDQGYRSIGCAPCTRKTAREENERAGRWTGFHKVECGIHTFMPKKVDFQI